MPVRYIFSLKQIREKKNSHRQILRQQLQRPLNDEKILTAKSCGSSSNDRSMMKKILPPNPAAAAPGTAQ
jgi:hypothetical protein